ncbi:hypothetical protein S40288_07796 [Stachybotrys chartarum IBT 40288]|nr:hypothetical protein S40288_07796 [Stachybotrys chartarum IBT 40288]
MERIDDEHRGFAVASPPHVSILRKAFNILGCIVALPLYWMMTVSSPCPVTLDTIVTVLLAELNRFLNEGRRMKFYEQESRVRDKADPEKSGLDARTATPKLQCMAAVVGWREEPGLFTRALESYRAAKGCRFVLVGIDGDEAPDEDMVRVFHKVYPEHSVVLHLTQPMGEVAQRVRSKVVAMREEHGRQVDDKECDAIALQHCIQLARTILEQQKIIFGGADGIRHLCVRQPHMHKKAIMFTSFVFSIVIADILGIEFLWSSDSDTLVLPDSLERTVDSIAADPTIGGASSGLIIHNQDESAITQLAATVYWGELYLTRSTPAPTATSDCQSGPSSVFRLAALPPVLVPWYTQKLFGKRMIINEDRHLTTNLLSRGWGVVYASDVLAATDTPTTLARWLKQQVRWGRATHAESLLQPKVYLMSHPLLFWGMAKREVGPVIGAIAIFYYFLTAKQLVAVSVSDLALRVLITAVYNMLRNPHRLSNESLRWVLPGIVFYYVPLPAVHVWSMMTMTADGWGTTMRSSGEMFKKDSVLTAWWETGFFVVWMGIVAGASARFCAGQLDLDWSYAMTLVILSTLGAAAWAWRATIYKISEPQA